MNSSSLSAAPIGFDTVPAVELARKLLCASSVLLAGCATRVVPPAHVAEPETVYIADYGHHASLILPRDPLSYSEFAFGEWGWFALGRQGWYRALPIIALTSPGTLGTRDIHAPGGRAGLRPHFATMQLHEVRVERARVAALRSEFDEHLAAQAAREVYNADLDMRFVPYPMRYSVFSQCNSVVAAWLRRLGCRVYGAALTADFEVVYRPSAEADLADFHSAEGS